MIQLVGRGTKTTMWCEGHRQAASTHPRPRHDRRSVLVRVMQSLFIQTDLCGKRITVLCGGARGHARGNRCTRLLRCSATSRRSPKWEPEARKRVDKN